MYYAVQRRKLMANTIEGFGMTVKMNKGLPVLFKIVTLFAIATCGLVIRALGYILFTRDFSLLTGTAEFSFSELSLFVLCVVVVIISAVLLVYFSIILWVALYSDLSRKKA